MTKKVVLFGGGTGLSHILSELKHYDLDLTAVVTVADNGGSTGKIRNFYDIPAPGDLRRCAIALSEDPSLQEIMNYRFDQKLNKHTVGNLILTAYTDMYGDMKKACDAYCKMLKVKHTVLPISNESLQLCATMESGVEICGETQISTYPEKISKLYYQGEVNILPEVIKAVNEADAIIFSCGSLYTSIVCNLLFKDLIDAFDQNQGKIIYICNLMTQRGETEKYQVSDHVNVINSYLNKHKIDCVIANNNYDVSAKVLENYLQEKAKLVTLDQDKIINLDLISDDYLYIDQLDHIRHNIRKICKTIHQYINQGN